MASLHGQVADGSPQMKDRRAATHDQFAILRIDDWQRAGEVRVHLDHVSMDPESPRLRIVRGRRKDRVAYYEPEFLLGTSFRGKVISRHLPGMQ